MSTNYTGEQIEVLRGLEAVRKRPGMYIGNTAERGLHQLVYEAVDNAVDEALAGYAHNVRVVLYADASCSVEDDGRGIPIDMHAEEKMPAVEVVMTILHAGGKFGKGGYKVSGGLHGVGISVVNALSEWMVTRVKRDGYLYEMKFERGITVQKLKKLGKADGSGTLQWFKPDTEMFEVTEFHWDMLQKRLRELAFLNRGLSITLRDERGEDGARAKLQVRRRHRLVRRVAEREERSAAPHHLDQCRTRRRRRRGRDAVYRTRTPTRSSRTPTTSARSKAACISTASARRVTTTVNEYARKRGMLKEADNSLSTDDIMEGLTAVVSVKLQDPQFEGQTKTKLGNARVRSIVARLRHRAPRFLLRRESEERARHRRKVHAGAARARSRQESARSLAPQERARRLRPARQTGRLQKHQSRRKRDLSRRGRFGRRHGQGRPRPEHASDPAAARQDPQRRESAARQSARQRRDPHDDHRVRHRLRRRVQRPRSCATTRSSS